MALIGTNGRQHQGPSTWVNGEAPQHHRGTKVITPFVEGNLKPESLPMWNALRQGRLLNFGSKVGGSIIQVSSDNTCPKIPWAFLNINIDGMANETESTSPYNLMEPHLLLQFHECKLSTYIKPLMKMVWRFRLKEWHTRQRENRWYQIKSVWKADDLI